MCLTLLAHGHAFESICIASVEVYVRAKYRGVQRGDQHAWSYSVAFRNDGLDTVQMLTRHWVFVDASRKVHEMKGPGARGVTPVLGPGDSWQV